MGINETFKAISNPVCRDILQKSLILPELQFHITYQDLKEPT